MSAFIDISGQRFGKLVAIRVARRETRSNGGTSILWECRCDCGNTHVVSRTSLYTARSCGCSHVEQAKRLGREKRKSVGHSARNKLMKKYEAQAEYRNLEWKLSTEQFNEITKQNCYYCGKEPSQIVNLRGCNGVYVYNGIDRLDNSKGYSIENCVPCCGVCNKAKMVMSENEFSEWISRVYINFASKRAIKPCLDFQGDGTAQWYRSLFVKESS